MKNSKKLQKPPEEEPGTSRQSVPEERYRGTLDRIGHLNAVLKALRGVDHLITREKDRARLIQESCELLVETRGYENAWILLVDKSGRINLVAGAGLGENFPIFLEQLKRGKYPQCVSELLAQKEAFLAYDQPGAQHEECVLAKSHGKYGVFRCKLEYEGKLYGILGVTILSETVTDTEEKDLFLELSSDISYALHNFEEEEKRRRVEEALQRSEANLAQAQQIAHLGSWDWDVVRNTLHQSDEIYRIFGLEPQQFGATYEAFLNSVHPDDRALVQKCVNEALYENKPYNIEHHILLPDGSVRYVQTMGEVVLDKDRKPVRMLGTMQDITERREMERQLMLTERLISLGELISGVAHELNNPLTGIIGLSELLLEKDVPDDVKEDLKLIDKEVKRTASIVRSLLTFARKQESEKKPVNMNNAIEDVLKLRAYEQRVSNIEVDTRFAPDLPEVTADSFQLGQVFLNIIINAEYFMTQAHGRGTLTVTTEQDGDIVRAAFADDGPGIAPEVLPRIFDPFFTTKPLGEGTGLGLSIAYGIVATHGGKIYAESELGKGATFIVELPLAGKGGQ